MRPQTLKQSLKHGNEVGKVFNHEQLILTIESKGTP